VSSDERKRLLDETQSEISTMEEKLIRDLPRPDRLNNLILRGAILHADAEMFFRRRTSAPEATTPSATFSRRPTTWSILRAPEEIVSSADGQYVGSATGAPHWYLARALLQFITPEPALDHDTRRWYLAVTAFLAARMDFANLPTHLDATEALFPDDPVLAFDRGWQSEAYATHLLQAHARALVQAAAAKLNRRPRLLCATRAIFCDSDGNPYGIKSERQSLVDAERRFAGAVRAQSRSGRSTCSARARPDPAWPSCGSGGNASKPATLE